MTVDKAAQVLARDGVRLAYADTGSGAPPLLFIHGWCCDRSHWRAQILEFQVTHRTIAVDLRGHGASDKPDQDHGIGQFVEDIAWLCREIGLDAPVIVGHSMGGVIGLNLVRKHPDLARALVMVDSPVIPLPDSLQSTADAVLAGFKSPAYRDVAKSFVGNFMFREDSDPDLKQQIVDGMAEAPQRLMWTALSDLLRPENIPGGPIPVPAIFVRAATQTATAEEITSRYPGVQVGDVDAAHFLMMERPDEFNGMLRKFVEGLA